MRYLSTRDPRPAPATHSFDDVLLAGLAEDGGLFVPESLPLLDRAECCARCAGLPYAELAARVVGLFAGGSFGEAELRRLCRRRPMPASAMRRWRRWCSSTSGCGCSSCSTARPWPSRTWRCSSSG